MNQVKKGLLVISALFLSITTMAHPGHGTLTGTELGHYLTSPVHLGVALAAIVLAVILIKRRASRKV